MLNNDSITWVLISVIRSCCGDMKPVHGQRFFQSFGRSARRPRVQVHQLAI